MNFKVFYVSLALLYSSSNFAQDVATHDSAKAEFVTSDIANFWQMYDRLENAKSTQDSLIILREDYLDKASEGLEKYLAVENYDNQRSPEDIQMAYLRMMASYPRYLASIRKATESVDSLKPEITVTFNRLKELYPAFKFPDAYFGIGFMNTGARSFPDGKMYIGAEIFAIADSPDYTEFPDDFWLKDLAGPASKLNQILAHEYTHGQQRLPPPGSNELLSLALMEGGAVFIAALATEGESLIGGAGVNRRAFAFGETYEEEIWKRFQSDMQESNASDWFYNASTESFPSDMGYYVGYKICQAYYQKAEDKAQAIKVIVEMNDYEEFLAKSNYGDTFK